MGRDQFSLVPTRLRLGHASALLQADHEATVRQEGEHGYGSDDRLHARGGNGIKSTVNGGGQGKDDLSTEYGDFHENVGGGREG